MKIIVRGVYIAPKIELLPDEESVLQLYEEIRDKAPLMGVVAQIRELSRSLVI